MTAPDLQHSLKQTRERLSNRLGKNLGEEHVATLLQQLDALEGELLADPVVPVALLGSTGSGKSTLLNALLQFQILPVSSMKPCTSVVTTVRSLPGSSYRAEVRFLTLQEWERELGISEEILATEAEDAADPGDWDAIRKSVKAKLRAVYQVDEATLDHPREVRSLPLPHEAAGFMQPDAPPLVLTSPDAKGLKDQLREYLSGEHRFWPLVKTVEITGPFETLPRCIKLVDLPGVNDPNEAREEVTRLYLRESPYLWALFNIKRGLTRDVRTLMLEQKLLRQLLLDGKVHALTLIGTHADEIDTDEDTLAELGLDAGSSVRDAVLTRNQKVAEDFQSELQDIAAELARQAGEGADGLARLQETLAQTRVFTVSSKAYLRLCGALGGTKDYGLESEQDTQVPQLRAHVEEIARHQGVDERNEEVTTRLDLLLKEIQAQFRARRAILSQRTDGLLEEIKKIQDQIEGPRRQLADDLDGVRHDSEEDFRHRQQDLEGRLDQAVERALRHINLQVEGWSGIHWATLRAIVARYGQFASPSTGKKHDLNASLAEPLLQSIPFAWDEFFGLHLERITTRARGKLERHIDVYLERLKLEVVRSQGFGDATVSSLEDDMKTARQSLMLQVDAAEGGLKRTIEERRRDLAAGILPTVSSVMTPAYERCRDERGPGMKARILGVIQQHAKTAAERIFATIRTDIREGVTELGVQLGAEVDKVAQYALQQADRVRKNVGGGRWVAEVDNVHGAMRELDEMTAEVEGLRPQRAIRATAAVGNKEQL
jgi:energy-coupling factor transporter ATP-binding protein EcfA2